MPVDLDYRGREGGQTLSLGHITFLNIHLGFWVIADHFPLSILHCSQYNPIQCPCGQDLDIGL